MPEPPIITAVLRCRKEIKKITVYGHYVIRAFNYSPAITGPRIVLEMCDMCRPISEMISDEHISFSRCLLT